ncbi:MAG: PorT family protein [Alistipes sp.]|nr:PorT family protein [Alistipes sp.]
MKKIILAVVALMATCTLSAQDLRVGLTGGLNFANLHYSQTNSSDGYLGINLGIKAEYDLSSVIEEGFYADARLLYTLKGGRWASLHQNLSYLELPLNFGYSYSLTNDVKIFGGLGPYLAYGIAGKNVAKKDGIKVKTPAFGDIYKRFDFGLNYNVGVELYDEWQIFIGFEHGLRNANKSAIEGETLKMHPLNFYIGCAYMF